MSENMRRIIFILSLVYFLSVALVLSGIALLGGINLIKVVMVWVLFGTGIIVLKAKVTRKYLPLLTFLGKKEVHHEA